MATMTEDERMALLAEARVGIIAVEWGNRAPLSVPIRYDYEPGGDVLLWTYSDSLKGKLLCAAGRFSLTSQTEDPPYRYVTVQGPVTSVKPATREWLQALGTRHLGEEQGKAYVDNLFDPGSIVVRMRPERWFSEAIL